MSKGWSIGEARRHLLEARRCIAEIDESDAGADGCNLSEATDHIDAAINRLPGWMANWHERHGWGDIG